LSEEISNKIVKEKIEKVELLRKNYGFRVGQFEVRNWTGYVQKQIREVKESKKSEIKRIFEVKIFSNFKALRHQLQSSQNSLEQQLDQYYKEEEQNLIEKYQISENFQSKLKNLKTRYFLKF
jgi:hypothetical protein